jgi:hypothetical protein
LRKQKEKDEFDEDEMWDEDAYEDSDDDFPDV